MHVWSSTVRYVPDKYFDVDGIATLVHHRGDTTLPGSPPSFEEGQPILLLHDAGVNGNTFGDLMDLLVLTNSPVSFDLPGHGRSGSLDSLGSVEAMAAHVESLISPWEISALVVVADGLGAAVGFELAANGHVDVSALICCGAVGPAVDLQEELHDLGEITSGKARRQFDTSGYAPDPDEKMMRKAFSHWVTTDPRATLGARQAQSDWSNRVDLSRPVCPTVVVVGEHTEERHKGSSYQFAESIADGAVVTMAEVGRHPAQESPAAFCAVVEEAILTSRKDQ